MVAAVNRRWRVLLHQVSEVLCYTVELDSYLDEFRKMLFLLVSCPPPLRLPGLLQRASECDAPYPPVGRRNSFIKQTGICVA